MVSRPSGVAGRLLIALALLTAWPVMASQEDAAPEAGQIPSRSVLSDVRINDVAAEDQAEVSMASDTRGNLYAGWIDNRTGGDLEMHCGFSRSTDGGKTWSATELYRPGGYKAAVDPVVVADERGNMYRTCQGHFGDPAWPQMFSRSRDGGATWSPWVSVANGDKPWLAARDGKVYLAYTWGGTVMFARSLDDGETWSAPASIGSGLGACLAVDSSGAVYATWGLSSIVFRRSADGGLNWSEPKTVGRGSGVVGGGSNNPVRASVTSCAVTPDGSAVHAAWAGDNVRGDMAVWDVWATHSNDGGATWAPAARVNDDNVSGSIQANPWLVLDSDGVPHVAWVDDRNRVQEAWYSNSSDGGKTWRENIRISDARPAKGWNTWIGHYSQLVVMPSGLVGYAYSDSRDGTPDVWFSTLQAAPAQRLARLDVSPSGATITADDTQTFVARGYDQSGLPMQVSPTWSATGGSIDAAGVYTPSSVGGFEIMAADSGVSGKARITVTPGALRAIDVEPAAATITVDETQRFSAAGRDEKGNAVPVSPLWSSTGGRVDGSGLFTPDRAGSFEVEASDRGATARATIQVLPGLPASIRVEPASVVTSALRTIKLSGVALDRTGAALPAEVGFEWSVEGPVGRLNSSRGPVAELYTDHLLGGSGEIVVRLGALEARVPVTVKPAPYPIDKSTTPSDPSMRDEGFLSLYPSFVCLWGVAAVGLISLTLALRWAAKRRRMRRTGPTSASPTYHEPVEVAPSPPWDAGAAEPPPGGPLPMRQPLAPPPEQRDEGILAPSSPEGGVR